MSLSRSSFWISVRFIVDSVQLSLPVEAQRPLTRTVLFNNHSKRGWSCCQATTHRPNGTAIGQRKLKVGQDTADHQFHLKLGEGHANATPDTPTKRQILKRRIAAFQKAFGPKFIRIWVDVRAVMTQIDAADDYGTRFK